MSLTRSTVSWGSGFRVGEVVPVKGVADLQDGVTILRWTP